MIWHVSNILKRLTNISVTTPFPPFHTYSWIKSLKIRVFFDDGSVLLEPVRKVHPTRRKSLSSTTVTVRVPKMRSFYSLENSIESPIEYEYFQAPSPEECGMSVTFNLDVFVMEGIEKSRFRNRMSTHTLISSDVNSSRDKLKESKWTMFPIVYTFNYTLDLFEYTTHILCNHVGDTEMYRWVTVRDESKRFELDERKEN